ncbi:type I-U CRISPR-associated helicase/endonuclease Cas3 [Polymorphospora sp. NPDC051019]|uniref:type I-G CRISPR-associated helicase/endonuclease Cas3g n=1 Tax=Polymorphospora sp. NPDC051019 TaxID=3155725 RepID=UPI003425B22A
MSLDRAEFEAFFAALHDGHAPFRWQVRLLDEVLDTGRWPDQLVAPTGAGKTSVIDVHVFAVAVMASGHPVRVPRRLTLVVDRRALVDDQHEHAKKVARALQDARGEAGVMGRVAAALDGLRWPGTDGPPVWTPRLRGGAPPSRAWRDDPTACMVICATPDMWGSRLLLSGYGSRPEARPREAGLLAYDTVAVIDEAHLSRQLLTTARRVAELAAVAVEPLAVPILQVVETTATPTGDTGVAVGVEPGDLDSDEPLRQRLITPKPVTLLPLTEWPLPRTGAARAAGLRVLADEAVRLRQTYGPTVGCFVNTVDVAVAVTAELRTRGVVTEMVCGRMRPHDLSRLRHERPGLLAIEGNPEVDVLVATQSLEVGVDLDLSAAVTELAPGGALAQRAGRVNRLGKRAAEISVAVPSGDLPREDRLQAYQREDLVTAHAWLVERQRDPNGFAPWALRDHRPPVPAPARDLFQRLELLQAWHLARTNDDLAAEQDDLTLWLSDDIKEDLEIGLVVRHALPTDPGDAVELIRALPPRRHETLPIPIRQSPTIWDRLKPEPGAVLVRANESPRVVDQEERLRPGDLLVVDDATALFTAGVFTPTGGETLADVLDAIPAPGPGEVVLRIEGERHRRFLDAVAATAGSGEDDLPGPAIAGLLREYQAELTPQPMATAAAELLDRPAGQRAAAEVVFHWAPNPDDPTNNGQRSLIRMIVVDLRKVTADAELRQTWTTHRQRVTLTKHSNAVADRAADVAARLGLGERLVEDLRTAGKHHDAGKDDDRFQRSLGVDPNTTEPMAKSGVQDPQRIRRLSTSSGLPTGWRHEQLSVVRAWPELSTTEMIRRDLVARLIGTSHGRGRHSFPHVSGQLVGEPDETAIDLFDEGGWDALIERTHTHWGIWGCAYLEALLRAADGQVSAEGS